MLSVIADLLFIEIDNFESQMVFIKSNPKNGEKTFNFSYYSEFILKMSTLICENLCFEKVGIRFDCGISRVQHKSTVTTGDLDVLIVKCRQRNHLLNQNGRALLRQINEKSAKVWGCRRPCLEKKK